MTSELPEGADGNPGRHFARGLVWVGSLRGLGQAVAWVSTLWVARLLEPADYGLVGMAMVFINIAQMISEFGLGSTVIAMQGLDASETEELHTASILLGAGAFALALLSAWPVAWFYERARVAPVVMVLGVVPLLNGAVAVPAARLTKALDYAGMATSDLLRSVVGSSMSLALALVGAGLWAVVGGQIAGAFAAVAFVWRRVPTSVRRPRSSRFREALSYSRETMLSRVAWMFYQGVPALVGGKVLGETPLGYYTQAFNLASIPGDKMVNVVTSVAQPVLARHQTDSATLRHLLGRIVEGVAFLAWPILAGVALVAKPGVSVVLGTKWLGAATPLAIAAIYNMVWVAYTPFSHVFLVTGAARYNKQIAFLGAAVLPGFFLLGAVYGGAPGLTAAWLVAIPLFGVPYLVLLNRLIGFGVPELLSALKAPALATAGMVVAVIGALSLPLASEAVRLACAVVSGAAVFLGLAMAMRGRALRELVSTLRHRTD